jgi:hypothetical protein
VLGEIGDRIFDRAVAIDVAEIDVQALASEHVAVGVAQPLADHDYRVDAATCVNDAVTTGERPALPGHRLDEPRHIRGVVGMLVRHHQRGRGLDLPWRVAMHLRDGARPLPPILGAQIPERTDAVAHWYRGIPSPRTLRIQSTLTISQ